ncbi:hypothetical protein EON77_12110, partial [bacterium]
MRILAAYVPALTDPLSPEALAALVLGLYAFGPTVDLPPGLVRNQGPMRPEPMRPGPVRNEADPDGCLFLIDTTGCSGLFGKPAARGEAVLAHKVREFFASLDLVAHVAIAEGPRLAAMFARLAHNPILVAKEQTVRALAQVPLSLLPLTPRELTYFLKLGFGTAGDLMALPPASLGARFERRKRDPRDSEVSASRTVSGPDDLLLLLRGEDRAPLRAYVQNDPPEAGADLAYPTASTEALSFVLKSLCDTLWPSMQGLSARKVSVRLRIDLDPSVPVDPRFRPLEGRGERAYELAFSSTFAPALGNREDVLAALRAKLERTFGAVVAAPDAHAETFTTNEVRRVDLRFDETVPTVLANLSLYTSEARAARALPKLLAELQEGLGETCVGRLSVGNSWEMSQRSALVPYAAWQSPSG